MARLATKRTERKQSAVWAGIALLFLGSLVALAGTGAGCRRSDAKKKRAGSSLPAIEVKEGSGQIFVYRAGDDFRTVTKISEVPVWARAWVRVLDPKVKGERGGWVYVANLCAADKSGRYPYRVVQLSEFESKGPMSCGGGSAPPKIIAYVSSTCPVCHKALAYLKAQGIPFTAKVVDKDPDAARELARKAAAAGMTVRGVPVFDIGGKLVPGFDPQMFHQFLGGR